MNVGTFNGTGVDCSGNSGESNRILTLNNTGETTQDGFLVYVSGLALALNVDYTVSHNNPATEITFLNPLWDDMTIVVNYYEKPTHGKLPLNARFIQKNICSLGDSCTVTEIAVTIGTDEYRTKSEVESAHPFIPCYVHVLSYEDEIVKQGIARAGDLTFWFDSSYESYFNPSGNDKVRITWNNDTYEVKNIMPFKPAGTLMLIEVHVAQI